MKKEKQSISDEKQNGALPQTDVSGSVTDKPKIIIIGDCGSGYLAAIKLALYKNNVVEIITSVQNIINK